MKRRGCLIILIFLILGCIGLKWYQSNTGIVVKYPYVQEYAAGKGNIKGNVDVAAFHAIDERFAIGANENGYAVFKDPEAAFSALLEKCPDGIKEIQEAFDLNGPFNRRNWEEYKTYGWQVSSGTEEAQEQARFVSGFLDIYENSF